MKIRIPDKKPVMMGRTLEGTIFEVVFLVMALVLWGFIAWLIARAPSLVPIHFDIVGEADKWSHPTSVIFPCLIMTVAGACMLLGAYFPKSVNLPVKVENARQVALVMRMMRILSLVMLLITLHIALSTLLASLLFWLVWVAVGLLLAIVATYTILIYKAR
jgi:hypothetical protein